MAGPDVDTGILLGVREGADLSREVQTHVQKLVGIGEDGRKRGTEIEVEVGCLDVKLRGEQAHRSLQCTSKGDMRAGAWRTNVSRLATSVRVRRTCAAIRAARVCSCGGKSDALSRSEYPSMAVSGLLIS